MSKLNATIALVADGRGNVVICFHDSENDTAAVRLSAAEVSDLRDVLDVVSNLSANGLEAVATRTLTANQGDLPDNYVQ